MTATSFFCCAGAAGATGACARISPIRARTATRNTDQATEIPIRDPARKFLPVAAEVHVFPGEIQELTLIEEASSSLMIRPAADVAELMYRTCPTGNRTQLLQGIDG